MRRTSLHQLPLHRQPPPHGLADVRRRRGRRASRRGRATPGLIAPGTGLPPLGKRFSARRHPRRRPPRHHPHHHRRRARELRRRRTQALRPGQPPRLLAAWHDDHCPRRHDRHHRGHLADGKRTTPVADRSRARATLIEQVGWKVIDIGGRHASKSKKPGEQADEGDAPEGDLPGVDRCRVSESACLDANAGAQAHAAAALLPWTARLLTAKAENAGRNVTEKELSDAMKDTGLEHPQGPRRHSSRPCSSATTWSATARRSRPPTRARAFVDAVHPDVGRLPP